MDEDRLADILVIGAIITVIILKITNVIKISWLWLLSPIWILLCAGIILAIGLTLICLIEELVNKKEKNNERS